MKLEFDEDGLGGEGGAGDNSVAKAKTPRARKEKKEPGTHISCCLSEALAWLGPPTNPIGPFQELPE